MKETALAVLMYAADFDDRFPPAPVWADSVSPYSKSYLPDHDVFRCPDLDELGPGRYGHAFYARLGLQSSQELADPMNTPMLFDSTDLSWSAYGDLSLLPAQGRHPNGTNVVAFADGHAHATTVPALFDAMRSKSR
ncbi:MAG TPA: hypothetical protein VHE55_09745 [Fimbriimonadaceae bacterium]|nr:hypothetical protein [Fimbriimonadaceae bacterium]